MGQSLNAIFWVRGVWFTNCENVNANQRAGEGNPPDARNEVRREYDGLGRLAAEYQDHDHAVVTSAQDPSPAGHSPVFRYVYGDAAHPDRLSGVMYPDGSSQWVGYGAAGSLDDRIGRVASVSLTAKGIGTAPTTPDERYEYLGLSTVVDRLRPLGGPSNGASLELSYALSGGAGDGGDQYGGLDRFGRVIEEEWVKVAANAITPIEHYRYGYDGTSDLLYKQDLVFPQMSELYHANGVAASTGTPGSSAYDFGHLWNFRRGELSASPTASRPNQVVNVFQGDQSFWSIDDAGHFARGVDDPSTRPVVAGKLSADQVGERVPVQYLPATENMPPSPKNVQAISIQFDAWGHLASVREWDLSPKPRGAAGWDYSAKPASDRPAQREYGYDALGRRIWEKIAGQPRGDLYYTPDGNVAAVYSDTQPASAYLWSPADGSLVLRDYNGERMYAQQDVAGGVTSIADAGGTPVQRFYYTPEGKVEWVSDGAGNRLGNATDLDRDGGAYKWRYLWHAQRYDGGGTYYMGPAAGGAEWDYLTAGPLKPDSSAYAAAGSAYSA